MVDWITLEKIVDRVVDNQFGEPFELYPWIGSGAASEGRLDPNRPVVKGIGEYVRPGAAVTGEGGQPNMSTPAMVQADVWLSVTSALLGDPPLFKKEDRCYFPDRDEWFSITFITPSATYKPNVHLIRLNENSVTDLFAVNVVYTHAAMIGKPTLTINMGAAKHGRMII